MLPTKKAKGTEAKRIDFSMSFKPAQLAKYNEKNGVNKASPKYKAKVRNL